MRPIRGLTLFGRTNESNRWIIAAWHNPRSITWRWLLSFGWAPTQRQFNFHRFKINTGLSFDIHVPFVGWFAFRTQRSMFMHKSWKPKQK
jgi:hypothetical protein